MGSSRVTEIHVNLMTLPGRTFRGYRVAIALEDGTTVATSEPRDLQEGAATTISVPLSRPLTTDRIILVKILNNRNRTVKSERRRI